MRSVLTLVSLSVLLFAGTAQADSSDYDVSPSNGTASVSGTVTPSSSDSSTDGDTSSLLDKAKQGASDLEKAYDDKVDALKEKIQDKLEQKNQVPAVAAVRG